MYGPAKLTRRKVLLLGGADGAVVRLQILEGKSIAAYFAAASVVAGRIWSNCSLR